jgi:hypothetical protein
MGDQGSQRDPGPVRAVRLVSSVGDGVVRTLGVLLVAVGGFATSIYLFPLVLSGGVLSRDGSLPDEMAAAVACLAVTCAGFLLAPGVQRAEGPAGRRSWSVVASGAAFWLAGGFGISGRGAFNGSSECGVEGCWPDPMQNALIGLHVFAVGVAALLVGFRRSSPRAQRYAPALALVAALVLYHLLWLFFLRDLFLGPIPAWYPRP